VQRLGRDQKPSQQPRLSRHRGADRRPCHVIARKRSRWQVETLFDDTKQYAGLGACWCWHDAPWSATSPWC
jgi:hypothetical protein